MERLLVIDDNRRENGRITRWLSNAGYEVDCAVNGVYGLRLLEERRFNMVITEVVMPDKDGLETISAIRKNGETLPIIAISGGGKIGAAYYLEMARLFGADRTLLKPVREGELLPVVRELIGKERKGEGSSVGNIGA